MVGSTFMGGVSSFPTNPKKGHTGKRNTKFSDYHICESTSANVYDDGIQPNKSNFSMSALIWVKQEFVGQCFKPIFCHLDIETAHGTIQALNCVVVKFSWTILIVRL